MPDLLPCGPIQNTRRVLFGDPVAQQLARLVPVDQEYKRRAKRGQESVTICGAVGLILPGDEKKAVVLAKPGRDMAVEAAPFGRKLVEQGAEEFCARPVHVGIGHGHGMLLDRDHHHMGVGGTYIVLDQ